MTDNKYVLLFTLGIYISGFLVMYLYNEQQKTPTWVFFLLMNSQIEGVTYIHRRWVGECLIYVLTLQSIFVLFIHSCFIYKLQSKDTHRIMEINRHDAQLGQEDHGGHGG